MNEDKPSGYKRRGRKLTRAEHDVVFEKQKRCIEGREQRKQQKGKRDGKSEPRETQRRPK